MHSTLPLYPITETVVLALLTLGLITALTITAFVLLLRWLDE